MSSYRSFVCNESPKILRFSKIPLLVAVCVSFLCLCSAISMINRPGERSRIEGFLPRRTKKTFFDSKKDRHLASFSIRAFIPSPSSHLSLSSKMSSSSPFSSTTLENQISFSSIPPKIRTGKEIFTAMHVGFPENLNLDFDPLSSIDINTMSWDRLASFNFKKGSEIITPTLTFSTTVSPIYQIGCVPHFIDVDKFSFLSNLNQIEKAINKKTVAIMLPNLLGNVIDWRKVYKIAKKYNLSIIEDSADTIGYTFNGKNFGKYSDISTNSLYASHVITGAGFGGVVCFNDKKNYERAKLLRGWGRSSAIFNESEGLKLRFNKKVDGIPYDGKYIFFQ